MQPIRAVQWSAAGDAVRIIDQRRLPSEVVERDLRTVDDVCDAIRTLAVRGAPAIGIAGAMGLVAAVAPYAGEPEGATPGRGAFDAIVAQAASRIAGARPTAVNLAWAVNRVVRAARAASGSPRAALEAMRREATAILDEDRAMCDAIGRHALAFVADGATVLTHCNAGALATAGIGTALAPVYAAHAAGRRVRVVADETRPLLQGSRLTAWELQRAGIPVEVIADAAAAALMARRRVDVVLVGADRIAANGDVANKVGTYGLAIAAASHGVPFVVCAPSSTIDPLAPSGDAIAIEERDPAELLAVGGVPTAPDGAAAWNPAFDVTPGRLVTAIVTDTGVCRAPYNFRA